MPKLPCPKYPEKCKTAQRCGVDIASGACTYDPNIKGMYKKCCVTENTEPPIILISYSKEESIDSDSLRSPGQDRGTAPDPERSGEANPDSSFKHRKRST